MRVKATALVLLALIGGSLALVSAATPIKFAQILRLVSARTPDGVVAGEVAARGVAEVLDKKMIESARAAGAGPATLAALERIRPKSNIAIAGVAGTQVTLDGRFAGRIDADGALVLGDVPPGKHEITATMSEHISQNQSVLLGTNQTLDLEMRLTSIYGVLSVTTNVADATIDVGGRTRVRGDLAQRRLAAGAHVLRVEAPLRQSHTETIEIRSGETLERRITLEPDLTQLSALGLRVADHTERHNYSAAQRDAASYLAVATDAKPAPPGVDSVLASLALAQLHLRDYTGGFASARRALVAGASFTLTVAHHHEWLTTHPARLTVTSAHILYDPMGPCSFRKGTIPFSGLLVFEATVSNSQRMSSPSVQVRFPKTNKPSEEETMNFIEGGDPLGVVYNILRAAGAR